jgi:hypothetical protein
MGWKGKRELRCKSVCLFVNAVQGEEKLWAALCHIADEVQSFLRDDLRRICSHFDFSAPHY